MAVTQGESDAALAERLATAAGELLLTLRDGVGFEDVRALRDAGDRGSHNYLAAMLHRERPGDGLLSEEGADSTIRLSAERVWIVDPLDGTREFGEAGRIDWAVHVALVIGGVLRLGAVSLPAQRVTYASGAPLPPLGPMPSRIRMITSRSRPPAVAKDVATALGAEVVPLGSAGAKAMAVVRGDAELYIHAGGMYEWDSAAPVAVAAAAGLHTSRIDGSPLVYNQADPYLPDLLVCRRELAADVLAVVRR